jgi:hypothetical protein
MKSEAGLDGRADTESTFQAIDPLVNKGQEEALNPNIITNRIHDQLTNVCGANQAAKDAAAAAQTQVAALEIKDASTANAWNSALGFAGTNTKPGQRSCRWFGRSHLKLYPTVVELARKMVCSYVSENPRK